MQTLRTQSYARLVFALAFGVLIAAAITAITFSAPAFAAGADTYKSKCAACHGVDATGKPAAKIPSLTSDDAKKLSDADLSAAITEKPKHAGVAKSLTPDQVKMVVSYIRELQKK